jgi:CubicO group peptidase (beta-lactamase class C family)
MTIRQPKQPPANPVDPVTDAAERILKLVDAVRADERRIGVFSTGESLAVALVLDRPDLFQQGNGYTMLEAVERLGTEWFRAALLVQRAVPEDYYRGAKR